MCGRLNVTDDAAVIDLLGWLGVSLGGEPLVHRRFIRAAEQISIVRQVNGVAGHLVVIARAHHGWV